MVHFKLSTLSGNTTIKIDVDQSTAIGALIRLVEMAFKAEIRGKGQVEERLDFHVNALFCSHGNKGAKIVDKMRISNDTVGDHFEDQVTATVMMAKTLFDGDEESEDGQSLHDWTKAPAAAAPPPPAAGNKRGADSDSKATGKKKSKKADGGAAAAEENDAAQAADAAELTFFSLEDNVQLTLPLGRSEDGSVDVAQLVRKIEASYVDNRKAKTLNDAFGLWEGERPIEITALIFFGLKDRSGGSFVKTISSPFPAKLLAASAEAPEAAELGVPLNLQEGDYVAFRFNRHRRAAQTVSAFPQGFVRSMNALATMAGDDSNAGQAVKLGGGSASAPFLQTAKELVLSKLKGHPQLLKVWQETFKVSEGGRVAVLDPSNKVEDGDGQVLLENCCEGQWRVGTMCTKFRTPTQILDSLVVCHEDYENVMGLSALIKKKGTSGWKKAGEVKAASSFAGIFDRKEYRSPESAEEEGGVGAYAKLNWQPVAIFAEGTYGKRPNDNETFPVYTKDRGGKIQAIKIMFLSGNDYK